jgi:tRNA pseudouridine38-40 synthase
MILCLPSLLVAFLTVSRGRHPTLVNPTFLPRHATTRRCTQHEESSSQHSSSSSSYPPLALLWESDPFTCVQKTLQRVLTTTPTHPHAALAFSLGPHHNSSEHVLLPLIFQSFYQGKLVDFVEDAPPSSRKRRGVSFRLDLAYCGTAFCGWQRQAEVVTKLRPAIQQVVEEALGDRNVRVAGRTDAGVHAVGQVARVRFGYDVTVDELAAQLQQQRAEGLLPNAWCCRRILPVSHRFHPIFGATSRSYVYLIDAKAEVLQPDWGSVDDLTARLNALLAPLRGVSLSYLALSYGRPKTQTTDCTLSHAYVRKVSWNGQDDVLAIELTGDRFLRRMVRILVSTALGLAMSSSSSNSNGRDAQSFEPMALLHLVESQDRRRAARPAPPQGLIFVAASYDTIDGDDGGNPSPS